MKAEIFETHGDNNGLRKLNEFLERDGKDVMITGVLSAASGDNGIYRHFVTVVYTERTTGEILA